MRKPEDPQQPLVVYATIATVRHRAIIRAYDCAELEHLERDALGGERWVADEDEIVLARMCRAALLGMIPHRRGCFVEDASAGAIRVTFVDLDDWFPETASLKDSVF